MTPQHKKEIDQAVQIIRSKITGEATTQTISDAIGSLTGKGIYYHRIPFQDPHFTVVRWHGEDGNSEHIAYAANDSPLIQVVSILHALGHCYFGDYTVEAPVLLRLLRDPAPDPFLLRKLFCRQNGYHEPVEYRAEYFASVLFTTLRMNDLRLVSDAQSNEEGHLISLLTSAQWQNPM